MRMPGLVEIKILISIMYDPWIEAVSSVPDDEVARSVRRSMRRDQIDAHKNEGSGEERNDRAPRPAAFMCRPMLAALRPIVLGLRHHQRESSRSKKLR